MRNIDFFREASVANMANFLARKFHPMFEMLNADNKFLILEGLEDWLRMDVDKRYELLLSEKK